MALCKVKTFRRGEGPSAVAAAAYRAGAIITSEVEGTAYDYTAKSDVLHAEILLPPNAPAAFLDRATLWNAVERAEQAPNAPLAWEITISLLAERSLPQLMQAVREYASRYFVARGLCADLCVHAGRRQNPHVHIMLTMRPFWGRETKYHKSKEIHHATNSNGRRANHQR